MLNAEEFDRCITNTNTRVDKGQQPENIATYSPCYPNDKYAAFPDNTSSCLEIYNRRMLSGTLPAGVQYTAESVAAHCKAKVDAIKPPQTPWDWLGNAVSDVGDAIKVAAPFVQTALSFVPGIGSVASAAIGAGVALASGLPIEDAMVAGVKGALPGGPIAVAAFEVGIGIVQGKRVEEIGINALPIPDVAKSLLKTGAAVTRDVAEGKPITGAALQSVLAALPEGSKRAIEAVAGQGGAAIADKIISEAGKYLSPEQQKTYAAAMGQGIAIGYAQDIQAAKADRVVNPAFIASMLALGKSMAGTDPLAVGTLKIMNPIYTNGFLIGLAFTSKASSPTEMIAIRSALTGNDKRGFDIAVSLRNGKKLTSGLMTLQAAAASDPAFFSMKRNVQNAIASPQRLVLSGPSAGRLQAGILKAVAKVGPSADAQAAYVVTLGMQGATPAQKSGMVSALIGTPAGMRGVEAGVNHVIEEKANRKGFFAAILEFLFGKRD